MILENAICYVYSREPESIVKPAKAGKPEDENRYNEQIEKAKGKAVRHLFLIRHGQYNLDGATDKERVLTELGNYFYNVKHQFWLPFCLIFSLIFLNS